MYILNTSRSRRALKPSQDKENMQATALSAHTRERARRAAETAEQRQERVTKRREIGSGGFRGGKGGANAPPFGG